MLYFIKKRVNANSFNEAVRLEAKAEIVDIWTEQPKEEIQELLPVIGFEIEQEEDVILEERKH